MKKTFIFLFIVCLMPHRSWSKDGNAIPLSNQLPGDRNLRGVLDFHRLWQIEHQFPTAMLPKRLIAYNPNATLSMINFKGELKIDHTNKEITSLASLDIKSLRGNLTEIYFYVELIDDQVPEVEDKIGPLSATLVSESVIGVVLRQPLQPGETVKIFFKQSGTPTCTPAKFLNLVMCNLQDHSAWNVGTSWQPLVYDLGTNDFAIADSVTLDVTVAEGMKVAATGLFTGERLNGDGTHTFSFSNNELGIFSVATAAFEVSSAEFSDNKQVRANFYSAGARSHEKEWLDIASEIMRFHQARYGDFWPQKVDVIEISDETTAAYGPWLAIFVPTRYLSLPPSDWFNRTVIAHELAHQWFAGMIHIKDQTSPWIAEGFATFAEMEYTSSIASKDFGFDYHPYYRHNINLYYTYGVPEVEEVPISSPLIYKAPMNTYTILTYYKGALVVNLLRYLLGDDATFYNAIKSYAADHKNRSANLASMIESLEKATGKELQPFFDRWAYGTGYPTYLIDLKRGTGPNIHHADITVTSEQNYEVPIEISIYTADNQVTTKRLSGGQNGTLFSLSYDSPSEIVSIMVDPDQQIPGIKRGALSGDIHLNGDVDGIDLISVATRMGTSFESQTTMTQGFAAWADLQRDGQINEQDLQIVLDNFGKSAGDQT